MSVSSERASVQFDYPTGFYSGAEIYITDDVFEKSGDLLDYWNIDLKTITDRWQDKQTTFIGNTPEIYDEHIKKLMKMNENGSVDLVQLRLICLMILNLMSRRNIRSYAVSGKRGKNRRRNYDKGSFCKIYYSGHRR